MAERAAAIAASLAVEALVGTDFSDVDGDSGGGSSASKTSADIAATGTIDGALSDASLCVVTADVFDACGRDGVEAGGEGAGVGLV